MADLDKLEKGEVAGVGDGDEAEERDRLMESKAISVLDFDMLCSTVALQMQGKWRKLESVEGDDEGGNGENEYGGVLRMWEGDVLDCFEDRHICIESTCCPCYRFGKNMRRAGFGSCFIQGTVYLILITGTLLNFAAFAATKRHCFIYLALVFIFLVGTYLGYFRMQMKRKFNVRGTDSFLDDCIYHITCPCCTLSQESRTLEMNNVHDGIWHGRGDTLCIGSYPEEKAFLQLRPPPVVSTVSPEPYKTQPSLYDGNRNSPF